MTFQSYPKISYQTIQENVAQLQAKQNKLNESVKPQIIGDVKKPGAFANLKEDSQAFIESVSDCLYNRLAYIIYESVWLDKAAKEQLKESLILELVEGLRVGFEHKVFAVKKQTRGHQLFEATFEYIKTNEGNTLFESVLESANADDVIAEVREQVKQAMMLEKENAKAAQAEIDEIQAVNETDPSKANLESTLMNYRLNAKKTDQSLIATLQEANRQMLGEAYTPQIGFKNTLIQYTLFETMNSLQMLNMTPSQYTQFKFNLMNPTLNK